jgi:hypothetical protein
MCQLLPALRKVGFHLWDPLGLCETWQEGEEMGDEYDSDLMRAYSATANGRGPEAIFTVLREAEAAMGIPGVSTSDSHMKVAQGFFIGLVTICRNKMRPHYRRDYSKRNKS